MEINLKSLLKNLGSAKKKKSSIFLLLYKM